VTDPASLASLASLRDTEGVDPAFADLDALPTAARLAAIVAGQRRAVDAVAAAAPELARAADAIASRLAAGGRLAYAGAGTSGRLAALDAAELPPTFAFERTVVLMAGGPDAFTNSREGAEDDAQAGHDAVTAAALGASDALIGVAASGRTPFTIAAVRAARAAGAFTVAFASVHPSPLLAAADVAVWLDTGPEVLAGSTRLAAGTAQKAALNALSTAVMIALGGAYGNLMVGMRASNAKLRIRAAAIVARACAVDAATAQAALDAAGGDVRTAIVTLRAGVSADVARAVLARHTLRVRDALAALNVPSGLPPA
jgi:N-acetylmuramic acid 6-phosphate etherase